MFILVAEVIAQSWSERNAVVFRDKWAMSPPVRIWRRVVSNLEAIWVRITSPQISDLISREITLVKGYFEDPTVLGDLPPDYD